MSGRNKNTRGGGKTRGSNKVGGRGHATLGGGGAGRGNGNNHRGQQVPEAKGLSSRAVLAFGLSLVGFGEERQTCGNDLSVARFRSFFGPSPRAIKFLITLMTEYQPDDKIEMILLFMAISWLHLYDKEHVMAGRWGFGEKYCREQVRLYVQRMQALKPHVVNFDDLSPDCKFAPLDDMHVRCHEFRCDPNSTWWSHKFNGPGVGFEVVCNPTDKGLMLWASGPHPAGTHDLTPFRGGKKKEQHLWKETALYHNLPDTLRLVGDSAYAGQFDKVTTTMDAHSAETKELFARMKSMQETCFKRIKDYKVLRESFRHGKNTKDKLKKVGMSFDAVVVLVQLDIATDHPLFEV